MRIGIDLACWSNGRGYGRYTRELVRALVTEAPNDEFLAFADDMTITDELQSPNLTTIRVPLSTSPTEAASANGNRSPTDMLRLTRAVWRESPDVFFAPTVYTYFPLPPGQRGVVTLHDAIAERFPELTLPSARARLFWNAKVRLAIWQCRLIATVSEFSARELKEVLGVPPSRIRITGEAPAVEYRPSDSSVDIANAAAQVGLPKEAQWFVYVGGFNPHKHVDTIVRAHAAMVRANPGGAPYLLLVGTTTTDVFHDSLAGIRAAIADAGTGRLVRWTGYVPDETLRHLHSGSLALLLPSESEGFGLPAVEAAACGAPVVATTQSPLPKVLAGGGIFVPPGDEGALLAAMMEISNDDGLRRKLGRQALSRAAVLTWQRSARAALDILHEAAA